MESKLPTDIHHGILEALDPYERVTMNRVSAGWRDYKAPCSDEYIRRSLERPPSAYELASAITNRPFSVIGDNEIRTSPHPLGAVTTTISRAMILYPDTLELVTIGLVTTEVVTYATAPTSTYLNDVKVTKKNVDSLEEGVQEMLNSNERRDLYIDPFVSRRATMKRLEGCSNDTQMYATGRPSYLTRKSSDNDTYRHYQDRMTNRLAIIALGIVVGMVDLEELTDPNFDARVVVERIRPGLLALWD